MIAVQKRRLREELRTKLRQLSREEKSAQSHDARQLLRNQPVWRGARSVLLYASMPDEVDVMPLLDEALADGKQVFLPRYDAGRDEYHIREVRNSGDDLVPGHHGIREPAPHGAPPDGMRLDFILVPGLGFDNRGGRLGRGKGYYDRLLKVWTGVRCGIGFDCQLCDVIPAEPHDETLKLILTPSRWIVASPEGG